MDNFTASLERPTKPDSNTVLVLPPNEDSSPAYSYADTLEFTHSVQRPTIPNHDSVLEEWRGLPWDLYS